MRSTEEAVSKRGSVEQICFGNTLYAIIVYSSFAEPGVQFFTPHDFSQQLAFMRHPAGKLIEPHTHNPVIREVHFTKEVLFIRKGKLRVDFYTEEREYMESRVLETGDAILLSEGGHGFEVLEEIEMLEVKQGPYAGEHDKTRFPARPHDGTHPHGGESNG
jgi:mannose-6-phosphate isomerase-like protein (cupin superfamily)